MALHIEQQGKKTLITCTGKNLSDAFSSVARGFFSLSHDTDRVRGSERLKVALDADSLSSLLKAWLEELKRRSEEEKIVLGEFRVASIQKVSSSQYLLTGEALGEKYSPAKHARHALLGQLGDVSCKEQQGVVECACVVV